MEEHTDFHIPLCCLHFIRGFGAGGHIESVSVCLFVCLLACLLVTSGYTQLNRNAISFTCRLILQKVF